GKTLQTISFINYLLEKYPGETHLVVCPTSLMYNWEAELKKFSPDISYCIYHGANRSNLNIDGFKGVVITSYGVVRSDIDRLQEQFFGYIILDESHTIRNPDSQTTRAVLQLNSRNRMIISGTPV